MDLVYVRAKWTWRMSEHNCPGICQGKMDLAYVRAKWTWHMSGRNGLGVCQVKMETVGISVQNVHGKFKGKTVLIHVVIK